MTTVVKPANDGVCLEGNSLTAAPAAPFYSNPASPPLGVGSGRTEAALCPAESTASKYPATASTALSHPVVVAGSASDGPREFAIGGALSTLRKLARRGAYFASAFALGGLFPLFLILAIIGYAHAFHGYEISPYETASAFWSGVIIGVFSAFLSLIVALEAADA